MADVPALRAAFDDLRGLLDRVRAAGAPEAAILLSLASGELLRAIRAAEAQDGRITSQVEALRRLGER